MKRRLWMMPWPVFSQALIGLAAVMLLFVVGDGVATPVISRVGQFLGIAAGMWLGRCAAGATTETVTEYLGQLPVQSGRLRTLVVDVGFVYLLVLVATYLLVTLSGLGDWLVERMFTRLHVTDSVRSGRSYLGWLDMAVLAPLSYWTVITVRLHTRSLTRVVAFVCFVGEAAFLIGLPIMRLSWLLKGLTEITALVVAYGMLAMWVALTIILRGHSRALLRGDARTSQGTTFAT